MRGALEHVVVSGDFAALDGGDFLTDPDHRFNESIEFDLRLALRRFDHHRASHREGHGRRMKPIVHQPLGHVLHLNAGRTLRRPRVENAFVGNKAVLTAIQHRIVTFELLRDVVGIQNRHLGRRRHPCTTHQADVHE